MGFTAKHRQARQELVDRFLNETSANAFVIDDFLEWLEPQTENQFWDAFFGKSTDEMARLYQRDLVRQFISPLRFSVRVAETETKTTELHFSPERTYPSLISPTENRRNGGGYVGFDPENPAMQAELRLQGAQALRGWIGRYGGTLDEMGVSTAPLWDIIAAMTEKEDTDAA